MTSLTKLMATGALAVIMTAGLAEAATLSLDTTGSANVNLDATFNPTPSVSGIGPGDAVTNYSGLSFAGGLLVSGPAKITFTYLGKEAGYSNSAVSLVPGGGTLSDLVAGASITFDQLVGGLVPFSFKTTGDDGKWITNGWGSNRTALDMAFMMISSTSYFALFGDGGGGNDDDLDDMVIRIDVAPIPLPAGGLLLIGALGGLAALRRRKSA